MIVDTEKVLRKRVDPSNGGRPWVRLDVGRVRGPIGWRPQVRGAQEALSGLSEVEFGTRNLLEERRSHILSEARSEILLQDSRVEQADSSVQILKRHLSSLDTELFTKIRSMSWFDKNMIQSKLQCWERVHQEARDLYSQEMDELKKTQEWQANEFSRQESLRENEPTAQIQELQDRANCMNDSGDFQDAESICSSRLSHVPSEPVIVPSLSGMSSRDYCRRPVFDTRDLHGTWEGGETFLKIHLQELNREHLSTVVCCSEEILFQDLMAPCSQEQGNLSTEVMKWIETQLPHGKLKGRRQTGSLHLMQKECIHKVLWLNIIDSRTRNCISRNSLHLRRFHVGE